MIGLNKIYNCDCIELMKQIDDESIDLTITSPPYYNFREYDNFSFWNSYEEYLGATKEWFKELFRITKKGGYVCWNIQANLPNPTKNGREDKPLMGDTIIIGTEVGFIEENDINWVKNAGTFMFGSYPYPTTPCFRHTKEIILVFRKRGKRNISKEEKEKCKLSKNRWFEITNDLWTIAPESAKRIGHPAPFPLEIPKRFIEITTVNSSVVFDPFCGSGTTALAATILNRNFITCDTSSKYCSIAENRIKSYIENAKKQVSFFE